MFSHLLASVQPSPLHSGPSLVPLDPALHSWDLGLPLLGGSGAPGRPRKDCLLVRGVDGVRSPHTEPEAWGRRSEAMGQETGTPYLLRLALKPEFLHCFEGIFVWLGL